MAQLQRPSNSYASYHCHNPYLSPPPPYQSQTLSSAYNLHQPPVSYTHSSCYRHHSFPVGYQQSRPLPEPPDLRFGPPPMAETHFQNPYAQTLSSAHQFSPPPAAGLPSTYYSYKHSQLQQKQYQHIPQHGFQKNSTWNQLPVDDNNVPHQLFDQMSLSKFSQQFQEENDTSLGESRKGDKVIDSVAVSHQYCIGKYKDDSVDTANETEESNTFEKLEDGKDKDVDHDNFGATEDLENKIQTKEEVLDDPPELTSDVGNEHIDDEMDMDETEEVKREDADHQEESSSRDQKHLEEDEIDQETKETAEESAVTKSDMKKTPISTPLLAHVGMKTKIQSSKFEVESVTGSIKEKVEKEIGKSRLKKWETPADGDEEEVSTIIFSETEDKASPEITFSKSTKSKKKKENKKGRMVQEEDDLNKLLAELGETPAVGKPASLPRQKEKVQAQFELVAHVEHAGEKEGDDKDITLILFEGVKKSQEVYMEAYTSLLSFGLSIDSLSNLEKFYEKPIILSHREMVEEKAGDIIEEAIHNDIAFLVVGDPFRATTHNDLVVGDKTLGVKVDVVHNASVVNVVGICGLQLYHYGETILIPFFTETWRPHSFYENIKKNHSFELHTLCLLDIRVKEPNFESMQRWRTDSYIMITGTARWILPPLAITIILEHEKDSASTYAAGRNRCAEVERTLTDLQGNESEKRLHALTLEMRQIKEAMGFDLNNADAAREVVEVLKDESKPYRCMVMETIDKTNDDAKITPNGCGVVVNALGQRVKLLPRICDTIKWRLNNKSAKHREVLISIIVALKAIGNVIGITKMNPPIKDLLPRFIQILKNTSRDLEDGECAFEQAIMGRGMTDVLQNVKNLSEALNNLRYVIIDAHALHDEKKFNFIWNQIVERLARQRKQYAGLKRRLEREVFHIQRPPEN